MEMVIEYTHINIYIYIYYSIFTCNIILYNWYLTKVKLLSLPSTVRLVKSSPKKGGHLATILRLADEAQSLQVPINQGMAPSARLVVVDVEKSNDPGVYKA